MKSSFKFKIATLSFAVSGALLTTFGFAFSTFIYSSGIERIDRELRSLLEVPMRTMHPTEYWNQLGTSIQFIQEEGAGDRVALLVLDRNDAPLFETENTPTRFRSLTRPKKPVSKNSFPPSKRMPRRGRPPHERPIRSLSTSVPITARFETISIGSQNWRVSIFCNPEITTIAAINMNAFNTEARLFRMSFMIAVPLGLIVLGAMGWYLADRALRPIAAIADTAEGITALGLDKRIPNIGNDKELARLVSVSNNMLDRLEKSYHQATRFSADAAHELQTPLTIMQGELDNAIQSSENGSTEQQRYSMLLEELRNLKAVVQKLLLLSHVDEGRLTLNPQPVNLSGLISEAAEDIEIMAPKLLISTTIQPDITVLADPPLLNQIIRNMTSNAAKYADAEGTAVFTLRRAADEIQFTLANTAQPIPTEDRPLLFDRFHRVDKARTTFSSGLGLSLAREIARTHGGDLVLNPYANGMVSFSLILSTK